MNNTIKIYLKAIFCISILYPNNIEKELQTQFILAEPGDTIFIPEGIHSIKGTLSIEGKRNLVIRGFGTDLSILSFVDQDEGAQGISITNSENIIPVSYTHLRAHETLR